MYIIGMGDLLLALRAPHNERLLQTPCLIPAFSGAEMNVCVSCSQFGLKTKFIGAVPDNALGKAAIKELKKESVEPYVVFAGKRMSLCYVEKGANQRGSTVLYDRENISLMYVVPADYNWDDIFKEASWFHITGITPALSQSTAELALFAVKKAKEKGLTVSCDLNFRKKLWNYGKQAKEVMPAIVEHCDVLIGNEEDIQHSLGIVSDNIDTVKGHIEVEHYKEILDKVFDIYPNIKKIAVSLRTSISADHNRWSALLADRGKVITAKSYDIKDIVDRVGGGDSFAGGLISGFNLFDTDEDALEFATAASCLKHSVPGDLNLVSFEEVTALMRGDGSGRVQR
ncbi:MAG: 2-dehydro-3-deoxygluconokinase [Epulopiscium sp. Nele67-Bin004]|nr:MAG: 2-dehydro-3-deoxygluconokinase [Epulopiscium sp. Nele67-Bin004]